MTKDPLFEGPACYATQGKAGYEIVVYSSNAVQHVLAGTVPSLERAETLCGRFNAYPRQTRQAFGLI